MKVCFVGTGSIGKRHIDNLTTICANRGIHLDITALRHSKARALDNNIKTAYSIDELSPPYDIIFIANPTSLHYQTLAKLNGFSKCFFIEKPLFESSSKALDELNLSTDSIYYIACPLRYTKIFAAAKDFVSKNKVYSARSICSSYLPDWRPYTDYRHIYSAFKEQGGGVCIDIIHEWDYLVDLFGFPQDVINVFGNYSNLEINSEDLAVYIGKYKDKLIELHLDYFGRETQRYIEIFSERATVKFDFANGRVLENNNLVAKYEELPNDKYVNEMNYFIDVYLGKKINNNPITHAMAVLKIAETPEQ